MAYPPGPLPTNATDGTSPTDTTPTAVLTAGELNGIAGAVNDIVAELGSNPSGASATVGARLDGIEADVDALGSGSIPDGSVSTAKLADGAVTAAKVAADVATQAELDAETAARTAAIAGLSGTYARKAADWATGVAYAVGELVSSGGTLYRCTVAHTSSGSFAAGNFSAVSGGGGAVSSVVGQTGAVTGTQIVADATVAAALAGKAPLASPALTGTPTVPTAAADTNTTQVASTAFVLGQAGSAAPVVNGTAAAGTSPRLARQDHVHPTDTSRAAATHVHSAADVTSGTLPLTRGGTGGTDAATARTALGLEGAAVLGVGTAAGTVAAGDDSRITGAAQKASNLSDLASAATARTNLGLGTAATVNTGTASGDVPVLGAGGVLPIARVATGTPDGTKFVRDDGTLAVPAGGGGGSTRAPWFWYPSGFWAGPPWAGMLDTNTFTVTLGRLYAVPFPVDVTTVVTAIGTNVGAASTGAFVRFGIYAGGPRPSDLVSGSDTAQLGADSVGSAQVTYGSPVTLSPGIYWLALVGQGVAPKLSFVNSSGSRLAAGFPGIPGDASWAGTFPSSMGTDSVATTNTGAMPSVFGAANNASTATYNAGAWIKVKVQ